MSNSYFLSQLTTQIASVRSDFERELWGHLTSILPGLDIYGFALECKGGPRNLGLISMVGRRSRIDDAVDPQIRYNFENWEYIPSLKIFNAVCKGLQSLSAKVVETCESLDEKAKDSITDSVLDVTCGSLSEVVQRFNEQGRLLDLEVYFLFITETDADVTMRSLKLLNSKAVFEAAQHPIADSSGHTG